MRFTFEEKNDEFIFKTFKDDETESIERMKFVFSGFSNKIHPYFVAQIEVIKKVLASADIHLNIHTVPTVDDISSDTDGFIYVENVHLPKDSIVSGNGNTYYLVQDEEMGRGWAVLLEQSPENERKIIVEDHRDTVRDTLLQGDFIRSFGIDYTYN